MTFLRKWGLSIAMIVVIIATFSYGFYRRHQWTKEHVLMELRPIAVRNGWGYDILRDGHPFFHQDIIPGVSGNRVFRSKEDALTVGRFMCDKIKAGKLPAISEAELEGLHIYIPPDTSGH
jgi:uncharacterized protein DUF4907